MAKDSYTYRSKPGASAEAPVLFLFHGTGGDENQFFDLGSQLMPGARLVAPRGDVSENGALRYFRRFADGSFDMDDLAVRTTAMAGFVTAQIAETQPARVVALGYSNGANIIANMLIEQPEPLDVTVLMHPQILFTPKAQPGLVGKKILITAGRRDPICPPVRTEQLHDYLVAQGADVTLFWHEGGHEIRQDELTAVATYLLPLR